MSMGIVVSEKKYLKCFTKQVHGNHEIPRAGPWYDLLTFVDRHSYLP
jgi:hypothetical protein